MSVGWRPMPMALHCRSTSTARRPIQEDKEVYNEPYHTPTLSKHGSPWSMLIIYVWLRYVLINLSRGWGSGSHLCKDQTNLPQTLRISGNYVSLHGVEVEAMDWKWRGSGNVWARVGWPPMTLGPSCLHVVAPLLKSSICRKFGEDWRIDVELVGPWIHVSIHSDHRPTNRLESMVIITLNYVSSDWARLEGRGVTLGRATPT